MPDATPEQFWLLTGDVPTGPFTVPQIHAKLASGEATWQTPACPLGGATWLSLVRTPGIGPGALPLEDGRESDPPSPSTPEPRPPTPPSSSWVPFTPSPGRATPPPVPNVPIWPVPDTPGASRPAGFRERNEELIGMVFGVGALLVVVVALGAVGYGIVALFRPPTATEVCKKLDEAKTAAEAKKYVTPRVHPLVDALFAAKSPTDPNDDFTWTQEVDGPAPDTKLVGFRGTWFLPEAGTRVRVEGHCKMVQSDGWKVDDMVFTGVEGAALPGPMSLVEEHRASLARPNASAPGTPSRSFVPGSSTRSPGPAPSPRSKHPIEKIIIALRDAVGWGGIVGIVVLLLVGAAVRESVRKKAPGS